MPVILMTGYPSSGKSTRVTELTSFFGQIKKKNVKIVSENHIIKCSKSDKNAVFRDPAYEKGVRGQLMSEVCRLLGRDTLVIIDAGNYIKGYRYELYCATKNNHTTECVIHCDIPVETAWQWNCSRGHEEQYTREIFDALVLRYETPDSRNRWDSPLITTLTNDQLPLEDIHQMLYERKPPPPNQSVQNPPVMPSNFLYEMDRITQDIVMAVMSAKKLALGGDIKIPGYDECVLGTSASTLTLPQLSRLRRQFLTYNKTCPPEDIGNTGLLFIQYLNTHLR